MIDVTKQSQEGGDHSTNIQANSVVVHQGLSLEEVRSLALELAVKNFDTLTEKAKQVLDGRVQEITDQFLKTLHERNPDGFRQAEDPNFQIGLLTVQKEYGRCGDKDLGNLLVDLLVDRSKHEKRDVLQIVLSESLGIAPKLTVGQLDSLAVIFALKYTRFLGVGNRPALQSRIREFIVPLINGISDKITTYQHLEFAGCGTIGLGGFGVTKLCTQNYPGLFM